MVYNVAYKLEASAGSSGLVNIFTIISGQKMRLKKATFVFPTGSGFYLELKLLRGDEQFVPNEGAIMGDGNEISVETDVIYESDQPIVLYYKNNDTSNSHSALILLQLEVIDGG